MTIGRLRLGDLFFVIAVFKMICYADQAIILMANPNNKRCIFSGLYHRVSQRTSKFHRGCWKNALCISAPS